MKKALLSLSFTIALASIPHLRLEAATGALDIYWVDVEGGAATLIVTPAGESILIDSGNPGGRDPGRIHDVASKVAGLQRIDHLITTHLHTDHYGGAAEISQLMPISSVYDNGIPDQNPDNNPEDRTWLLKIKPYREFKADKRNVIKPGDSIPLKQAAKGLPVSIRCLAAKQDVIPPAANVRLAANPACTDAPTREKDTSDNANSIVMLLEMGDFQFFVAGDLTWNTERQLVCPAILVPQVDVYQVTHHGLDVSNNPLLIRALSPAVSIMSNGTQKGCGAETFSTLKSLPSIQAMYQIHRNLRADSQNNTANEHIANLEARCQANYIKLSLEPSAKTYTVSIPTTGHKRAFTTK